MNAPTDIEAETETQAQTQTQTTQTRALSLTVNGRSVHTHAASHTLLVDLLRDTLSLTGTHVGCDTSQCGACTVLLDGASVRACSLLAVQAAGRSVTTVEGLAALSGTAAGSGLLHPLQEAFMACHGLQCGFCTPGMLMSAACLLATNPAPSDAQIGDALDGNLCRCTGYVNIIAAVRQAAGAMQDRSIGAGEKSAPSGTGSTPGMAAGTGA